MREGKGGTTEFAASLSIAREREEKTGGFT